MPSSADNVLGAHGVSNLDWIGTVVCLGLTTALLLALQYGGSKGWDDPTVIGLFCVFAVLLAAFVLWERFIGPAALVPFSLGKRTQIGASLEAVRRSFSHAAK